MFSEFKKFVMRGNVVDLAVGVAIGSAFTGVVNALVRDFINPLVTVIYGGGAFSRAHFNIGKTEFLYGDFINTLVSFLIVALVVFFLVVQPINKLTELAQGGKTTDVPTTRKCPYCYSEIPVRATRCAHCTSEIKKKG